MSLCSLVIDRVNVRLNGKIRQRIGRIIIGITEETASSKVTYISKYVHYPSSEFVYSEYVYLLNGIDATTVATQGEKYSVVIDWARAAITGKTVIVCGQADIKEIIGITTCKIVDLQDFFFTVKDENIIEPISLARLTSKIFDIKVLENDRRDPFRECNLRIAMYHIMIGYQSCGMKPPFASITFPKVVKRTPVAKKQLTTKEEEDECGWNPKSANCSQAKPTAEAAFDFTDNDLKRFMRQSDLREDDGLEMHTIGSSSSIHVYEAVEDDANIGYNTRHQRLVHESAAADIVRQTATKPLCSCTPAQSKPQHGLIQDENDGCGSSTPSRDQGEEDDGMMDQTAHAFSNPMYGPQTKSAKQVRSGESRMKRGKFSDPSSLYASGYKDKHNQNQQSSNSPDTNVVINMNVSYENLRSPSALGIKELFGCMSPNE